MKTELEAAREIVNAFAVTRNAGHTKAVIRGAQNTDNCVVIALNEAHTRHLRSLVAKDTRIATIASVAHCGLRGKRNPIVLDNIVIQTLLATLLQAYDLATKQKTIKNASIKELAQEIVSRQTQSKEDLPLCGEPRDKYLDDLLDGL